MLGDEIEIVARFGERRGIELVAAFASSAAAADDADVFEHAEMLGDGLAGEARTGGELRDGVRLAAGETSDEEEPRFVAESGEECGGDGAG